MFLGLYVLLELKRTYNTEELLPRKISIALWMLDILHFLMVLLSSFYGVWFLHFNRAFTTSTGVVLFGVGTFLMLAGMMKFRSIKRVFGLEISQLVTTGVYRWTRNPQYLGWFLILLGISFIGSSGIAFLFTMIGIILFHYYITQIEEPYLELVFGDKYRLYKLTVPRYVGLRSRDTEGEE